MAGPEPIDTNEQINAIKAELAELRKIVDTLCGLLPESGAPPEIKATYPEQPTVRDDVFMTDKNGNQVLAGFIERKGSPPE